MEGDVPGEGAAGEDDEAVLEPGARIAAAIQAVEATEWGAPVSETGWAVVRALCGELVQKKRVCLTGIDRSRRHAVSTQVC